MIEQSPPIQEPNATPDPAPETSIPPEVDALREQVQKGVMDLFDIIKKLPPSFSAAACVDIAILFSTAATGISTPGWRERAAAVMSVTADAIKEFALDPRAVAARAAISKKI